MRVRTFLVTVLLALAVSLAWAGQDSAVRVINVRGYDLGDVRPDCVTMPLVITNFDELYNAIGDDSAAADISGLVDFNRETLLYFRWVGSGEDRIHVTAANTSEGLEVMFVFRPGMTLDLSPHHHLYAVTNAAKWRYGVAAEQ